MHKVEEFTGTYAPEKRSIKHWHQDDRPREKLLKMGANSLTNAELLAILLGSGTLGKSAIDLAKEIMIEFDHKLELMASADHSRFKKIKGIGPAKALTLIATIELSKRMKTELKLHRKFTGPEIVAEYYIPFFYGKTTESFHVVLLNNNNQIIRQHEVSHGILNSTVVAPREVFKFAIAESAAAIILIHNHPSGNPEPSQNDLFITKKLVKSGEILDIRVLDHIIIAGQTYTSFVSRGIM